MQLARTVCIESHAAILTSRYVQRDGIVGRSRAVADVIRRIELVSATRSTVLITGETGTGKELVARAVHNRSAQKHLPFIKVNCAAIPETLLESELFGHVKGAFTGATSTRKGKFSLANRGSIFLDEIGTMSTGLQAKLLRVLQEREIEPLGAERTEHVDVRVIAATNRDLRQLVDEGQFLADLFYRLHVVPIVVPPLRERPEDIAMLAEYFTDKHARQSGKAIDALEDGVVSWLEEYHWPGNVRELENTIERAVVLTTNSRITREAVTAGSEVSVRTADMPSLNLRRNIEWIERETIRRALGVSTVKGDAARLMGISARALWSYLDKYPTHRREPGKAMRFRYLVPAVLTLAVAAYASAAPRASATPSPIGSAPAASRDLRVYLINEAGVAPQTLEVAKAEAGEIWATVGLNLTWTSPPAPFDFADGVTVIVRRAMSPPGPDAADARVCSHPALGHVVFAEDGQAGNLIEVSFKAITSLVGRGSYMDRPIPELPALVRNRLLGRGLGRVVAHEIGHWVMGRGHTEDGLMKASFSVRDVLESRTAQLPRAWTAAGSELRLLLSSRCELVAWHRGARAAAAPASPGKGPL